MGEEECKEERDGEGRGEPASQPGRQLARLGRGVSIDFPIASGPWAANPGPGC